MEKANVVPIYKKGSRTDANNYKPVSLTSVPCKIMELIIKDAVLSHIESNDLITGHQHGFVSGRSSLTNCWRSLRRGLWCLTQDAVSTSSACTIKKRSTQYHTEDCCRNSMFGRFDINRDFLNKNQKIRFFRPPGPAAAGRVGLYILLLSFFLPRELIHENRPVSRPPILQNETRRWRCS